MLGFDGSEGHLKLLSDGAGVAGAAIATQVCSAELKSAFVPVEPLAHFLRSTWVLESTSFASADYLTRS